MTYLPFLISALLLAGFIGYRVSRRRRRSRLLAAPLTPQQRAVLDRLVPIVRRLPESLRPALEGKMNLFMDQVTFRGINELEVDDDMRLSIAAQACLLVVNSPDWYDTLRNVLIYPSTFSARRARHDGAIVHESDSSMAGESWSRGPIVLSWDHALRGGLDPDDGHNVVIHEFAHQLDSLTGNANGLPLLRKGQQFRDWEKAMLDAFQHHVESIEAARETVIDRYGATNHQEFFAEATVSFFEKPRALRRELPALYAQLSVLYDLDPAEWS